MTQKLPKQQWKLTLLATVTCLSGCYEEARLEELQHWIAQAKISSRQATPSSDKLPPLKPEPNLSAAPYLMDTAITPFGQDAAIDLDERIDTEQQRPPQRGAPDALENFSLASLQMAGTLMREGEREAVVSADGKLYPVHLGDYIGQQFGMVEHISENAIAVQELVRDGEGKWIARNTQLLMQGNQQ